MKRTLAIVGVILVLGLIVFTLFHNKQQRDEKAQRKKGWAIPVMVTRVKQESLDDKLSQVGVIVANNDVPVVSELTGKVLQVYAKEGSYISAGSPIARLENQVPEANLMVAQSNYEKAKKDLERYTSLHKQQLISDVQLESIRLAFKTAESQLIVAKRQVNNAVVVSPISGIMVSRPINIGTMVNTGMVIADIVDTSMFKVKLNVDEANAFRLKVGDAVNIETEVYPGIHFSGRIDSISAKGDEAHTYPVQVVIPNSNGQYPLKSGMFGKLTFNLGQQEGIVITRDALVDSIKNPQVYIVRGPFGKQVAKLQNIVVSGENGTNLVVKEGLKTGDSVVISGIESLRDNAQVMVLSGNGSGMGGRKSWGEKGSKKGGWSGKNGKPSGHSWGN
jgi:RND family efflux transporter MFP subunit